MAARHFNFTIGAVRKRLSDVYGVGTPVGGALDIPYRQILIQSEVDAFVGGALVTTTDYGFWITSVSNGTNSVMPLGPFESGPIKLSDLWVVGTAGLIHIIAIPY